MGWTAWFTPKHEPDDGPRPSLRDVSFDTTGLKVIAKTPGAIEWKYANDVRVTARLERGTPDRPLPPWTLDALRTEWRRAAMARSGGIVSVTFDRANGIPIATAISKFTQGLGYLYEGTVLVRFREALYSVTMHADEGRSTGTREAMVNGLLVSIGEVQLPVVVPPATSARIEGLVRDPYDERYDEPALHARSDDERLDELLPAHPLSRVRAWLQAIQQSLTVAGDLRGDVVAPPDADCAPSQTRQRLPAVALGVLFMQAGRIDRAEQHLAAGVPMRDGELILDTPHLGDTLMLLGVTREALDRGAEAVWAHERAVRVFAALNGDDDPHTIRARANLGRSYAALGRNAEAEPLLTAVIPVFERTNNKSELALALNALGLACQSQARHAEATRCFGRALTLFEELHGPNYAECATVLKNLARSAAATGDQVGSARALKRAESIRWLQVMERR